MDWSQIERDAKLQAFSYVQDRISAVSRASTNAEIVSSAPTREREKYPKDNLEIMQVVSSLTRILDEQTVRIEMLESRVSQQEIAGQEMETMRHRVRIAEESAERLNVLCTRLMNEYRETQERLQSLDGRFQQLDMRLTDERDQYVNKKLFHQVNDSIFSDVRNFKEEHLEHRNESFRMSQMIELLVETIFFKSNGNNKTDFKNINNISSLLRCVHFHFLQYF
jgi:hypothetical protein